MRAVRACANACYRSIKAFGQFFGQLGAEPPPLMPDEFTVRPNACHSI